MPETIFNLFVYTDGELVTDLGIESYDIIDAPTDETKLEFLRERALIDHRTAYKGRIVSPILTYSEYIAKVRVGSELLLFEEFFLLFKAPINPLFVLTVIRNGEPKINHSYSGDLVLNEIKGRNAMVDYLVHYTTDDGINFMQMFDDDYFKAIKLLFNNGHLVSSTKLLMIFIDTISFVEYGDIKGSNIFTKWLNTYTDLTSLNVSADELWELRNGILHMSNLHSRNVLNKKVKRLIPSVNLGHSARNSEEDDKCFDLLELIKVIATGVGNWMQSYNDNPIKIEKFVERYDMVISDARSTFVSKTQ